MPKRHTSEFASELIAFTIANHDVLETFTTAILDIFHDDLISKHRFEDFRDQVLETRGEYPSASIIFNNVSQIYTLGVHHALSKSAKPPSLRKRIRDRVTEILSSLL